MSVAVKWEGQEKFHKILQSLISHTNDLSPLFQDVGSALVASTQTRITEQKKSPSGAPWQALNPKYAARKAKRLPGIGLLEWSGDLVRSMTYNASSNSVLVGTNKEYAARLHFGGGSVAARPYLGISNDDSRVIQDLVKNYYIKASKG